MKEQKKMIGLDAGSEKSGIIVLENSKIREGYNIPNDEVVDFIINESKSGEHLYIVIEDVRPYNMRITTGIIQTIKFLGETEYRLKSANIAFTLIPRWEVKKWVYDKFTDMANIEIQKNIIRHNAREQKKCESKGVEFKPKDRSITFVYVDDRIVQKAMRLHWNIERQKGFAKKAMYNLKDHAWQSLALLTYAITDYNISLDK